MIAGMGGEPTLIPDIPICAVLIAIYLGFAVTNFTLFNLNRSKGHFFLPNALLGGFCMARILTCALRIGWSFHHDNVSLAIAAQIFVNVGILIVYIVNVIFAQRILRAKQPRLGWSRGLKAVFVTAYVLIGVALILVITLICMSFYTLNIPTLTDAKWIERGAILYLLIITVFPLIILALAFGLPRPERTEHFGHGTLGKKAVVLAIGSCLCVLIAGFKAGVFWSPARPVNDPAWYDSKAAFYCFVFVLEIIILALYTSMRIYKLFHVPDGASKRRTYVVDAEEKEEQSVATLEKQDSGLGSHAV